jgi:hypothetical protein
MGSESGMDDLCSDGRMELLHITACDFQNSPMPALDGPSTPTALPLVDLVCGNSDTVDTRSLTLRTPLNQPLRPAPPSRVSSARACMNAG